MFVWHIITGEYPPQTGGVADYTQLIVEELVRAGDEVHVWAPQCLGTDDYSTAVFVHRLPGTFDKTALSQLDTGLKNEPKSFRLLVQYVPHSFGCKGMNVAFCLWLARQKHAKPWIVFHEVMFPLNWKQPFKHSLLAIVQRIMASIIVRVAERVIVTIPAWKNLLQTLGFRQSSVIWSPVPSNLPTTVDSSEVKSLRNNFCTNPDTVLVGHFGTYGASICRLLTTIITKLLKSSKIIIVLIGRRSDAYLSEISNYFSEQYANRIIASGELDRLSAARFIRACDILIQPYPDGVSCRRTSVMAGLALGLPIVTTEGKLTESIWKDRQLVELAPVDNLDLFNNVVNNLIDDSDKRQLLGQRAMDAYNQIFSVEKTIERLRSLE